MVACILASMDIQFLIAEGLTIATIIAGLAYTQGKTKQEILGLRSLMEMIGRRQDDQDDSISKVHERVNGHDREVGEHRGMLRFVGMILRLPESKFNLDQN